MKYMMAAIIAVQFSLYCTAQNYTDVGMIKSSVNNSTIIKEETGFISADTNIILSQRIAPWFVERFKISAGFFLPVSNTNIRVGTNDGTIGTEIDFESDLGLKRNVGTFLADLQWRASRRSRFDLSYYQVNRSADYTLKKDIVFGDSTYHANASAKSFFNTGIYRFSYGYAIFEKPKFEFGVLIGAHIVGAKTGLAINYAGIGVEAGNDFGFTAPLPDFGLWGGYAFSNRFALNGEVDYFGLTIGDIKGRILAYNFLFTYNIIKSLDVAIGYTGLNTKVDVIKTHLNGHFTWNYNGPNFTATYSFGKKYWTH